MSIWNSTGLHGFKFEKKVLFHTCFSNLNILMKLKTRYKLNRSFYLSELWTAWNKFPFQLDHITTWQFEIALSPPLGVRTVQMSNILLELQRRPWTFLQSDLTNLGTSRCRPVPHRSHAWRGKLRCNCLWGHVIFSINITYRYKCFLLHECWYWVVRQRDDP